MLFVGAWVSAQVSFTAVPDKSSAKIGERIQLSFILTTTNNVDISQITFPGFSGFQMLGRNSSESIREINGKITRHYMETVVLMPQHHGRITVQPASVSVNGKRYYTNPVNFNIQKADTKKQSSDETMVFMDISLAKDRVFPNQTVNAEVRLFARTFDALRRRSEIEVPGMSDFQVVQISKNTERDFEQVVINREVFISEKIAEFQLTPKSTGDLVIPPFKLRVAVPLDFFEEKIIAVSTDTKILKVIDFPDNAPRTFTGAVGDFKFNTNLDKKTLGVNESLDFEIELTGEGNFSSINLPKIQVPKEIELYPPKTRNAFQATSSGEKGKIVNKYVMVPQYGGEFEIPSIEFSFFNPKTENFQTIQSKSAKILVLGDTRADITANEIEAKSDSTAKNSIQKTIDLIPDIPKEITSIFKKEEAVKEKLAESNEKGTPWWYLLAIIPLAVLSYWFFSQRKKSQKVLGRDPNHITQVFDYKPIIRHDLTELKNMIQLNNRDEFLNRSQKLLNNAVVFVNKEQRHYEVIEARKILSVKKSDGFADRWERLYNRIQLQKYANTNEETELTDLYQSLQQLIKELLK